MEKEKRFFRKGKCEGCNKTKEVTEVGHLVLCEECEDAFFEEMLKKLQDEENGKAYILDQQQKKDSK